MKQGEVGARYQIPKKILKEYEQWKLCDSVKVVMGDWQYDNQDLELLSTIMALHDIGFCSSEIEGFMRLLLENKNTKKECISLLEKHRAETLANIHFKEKQLERIDYLRFKIRNSQYKKGDD